MCTSFHVSSTVVRYLIYDLYQQYKATNMSAICDAAAAAAERENNL